MNNYILKNLRQNLRKYVLLFFAILCSVSLTMGILILNGTMQNRVAAFVGNFHAKDALAVYTNEYVDNEVVNDFLKISEVTDIDRQIVYSTVMNTGQEKLRIQLMGMTQQTGDFENLVFPKEEGIHFGSGLYEILADKKVAEKYGISKGQKLEIEVCGEIKEFLVTGLYDRERLSMQLQYDFYTDISLLEEITGEKGKCNKFILDTVDHNARTIEKVRSEIGTMIRCDYKVYTILSRMQIAKDDINTFVMSLWAVLIIVVLCTVYVIFCSFSAILGERIHTIALFRILGANSGSVKKMVLKEGMGIGLAAGLLGTVTGTAVGYFLSYVYAEYDVGNFRRFFSVRIEYALISIGVGLIASYVGSIFPLKKIAAISPIAAMRNNVFSDRSTTGSGSRSGLRFICGLALLLGAVLMSGLADGMSDVLVIYGFMIFLGVSICVSVILMLPVLIKVLGSLILKISAGSNRSHVQLSIRNMMRNVYRSGNVIALIIVAFTISIALNGMFSSVRESVEDFVTDTYAFDYILDSNYRTLEECVPTLEAIQNAGLLKDYTYENWYVMKNKSDNTSYRVFAVDAAVFDEYTGMKIRCVGKERGGFQLLAGEKNCFVSKQIMKERGLNLGDFIDIFEGDGEQKYRIAGTFNTFTNSGRVIYIDRGNIDANVFETINSTIALKKSDSQGIPEFESCLKELLNEHFMFSSVKVIAREWKQDIVKGTGIFDVMNALFAVVVFFSVVNHFIMSVGERKKDVGVLYSLGANKKYINRVFSAEVAFNIVTTCFVGILASYAVLSVFVRCIGQTLNAVIDVHYPFVKAFLIFLILAVLFTCLKRYNVKAMLRVPVVKMIKRDSE